MVPSTVAQKRSLLNRLRLYALLTRQDKPIGTLLLLWPTLMALWFAAQGMPSIKMLIVLTLGTWLMRSAGCALNDIADRKFDAHVQRTAQRVLATGALATAEAVIVAIVLLAAAAGLLVFLNPLAWALAVVAAVLAASYPYFKRFFPLPQAYLGIAFSFGIPMAFAAVQGLIPTSAWILFAANLAWVVAYDTEYAMVDRDDDIKLGLRSSAIWLGRADVATIMLCYGLYLCGVLWVGHAAGLRTYFYIGWGVAVLCALYHFLLIHRRERQGCFRAFRHNHWLGFALLIGVASEFARLSG